MRIIPVTFMAILVLTMTTSSASMMHPQEPVPQAFAQSTEESIHDLGNYVVFGFDEVELEKEVTVISGNAGVQNKNSEVEIGDGVTFEDPNSAVVGDEVEIDKKAAVYDVYYNELKNKGQILGTENTPLSLPVIDKFPDLPDFLPGGESIKVEQGETLSLPSGSYDKIKVKKNGILIFEGGSYSISSIKAEKETTIVFEDSTEIIVEDNIKIGKKSFFGPVEGSTTSASEILIFAVGKEKESDDDDDMDYGDDENDGSKKTKIEFKKESTVFANVFAPNGKIEIGKETLATGAFVANEVKVGKESILELESKSEVEVLIDEYFAIIEELQEISNIPDEEIIDFLESKIGKLREIVVELESKGFITDILVQRMSPTTSTIVFFDEITLESFEVELPYDALAALLTFGIIEEISSVEVFTGAEVALMLGAFTEVMDDLANLPDEVLSIEFFQLISCVGVVDSESECFAGGLLIGMILSRILHEIASHPEISDPIAEEFINRGAGELFRRIIPIASISGFKFNDLDNSGTRDAATEPLLPKWNFTITSKLIGGIESGIQTKGQTDSNGFYSFNDLDYLAITETIVIIEDVDQELIDQGWVHTTPSVVEIPFEPGLVRTDVNFGNRQEIKLTVIKDVINNNAGTAAPSDFTISVSGTKVSPSSFPGDSSGTTVTLDAGTYSVKETGPSGYIGKLSADCSGTIDFGDPKTCTITNDDLPPAIFPVLAIDVSPKNGGNACSIGNTLARDGATAGLDYRVFGFGTGGLGMLPGTSPFVAGCIAADFGEQKDPGPVTVTAGRDGNACGRGCTGTNCSRPTERFHVFSSTDLSSYTLVGSSPTAPPNQSLGPLRDYAFSVNDSFRYIAVCRSGAGPAASDVMVDSIVTGGFSSTPLPPSLLSSIAPGGPYFYPEINQTSVDALRPEVVTVPLKVEWESGYYASPITIEINNMTSGISSSVISVQNATHYKLFDMIFDVTSAAKVGEHVFEVLVTEISTSDTNSEEIRLDVE